MCPLLYIHVKVIAISMLKRAQLSTKYRVFDLDFLMGTVMRDVFALDWETFLNNERKQPLRIVSSSLEAFSAGKAGDDEKTESHG